MARLDITETRITTDGFAASYVHTQVCNGVIIATQSGDRRIDHAARGALEDLYPDRGNTMFNVDPLGKVGGSTDWTTQQVPAACFPQHPGRAKPCSAASSEQSQPEPPMSYRITGLSHALFAPLFGKSDAELAMLGVERVIADAPSCYPDRITMRDADAGETLLLLNHQHQPANSPYQSSHAIYVIEGATDTYDAVDEIPPVMAHRLLSLRGFNTADKIEDGRVVPGAEADATIRDMLRNNKIRYIHAHNAGHGCYSGLITRA
ncbi:DUF1203 domain-containing protein [Rhodobacteraceae bacterium N5(2021)]|uniref:DUF1203 domain-containing protein n=1 Tax=Gymnodinialimonas phycosphaerae TaxID=2841589 RepID=A0A975YEA0_9RHOB|nr:DUF1203 domain-containing protein [Gymnodinialimonas phycosphaerae]